MKRKALAATTIAGAIVALGLWSAAPSRAGVWDFLTHKTQTAAASAGPAASTATPAAAGAEAQPATLPPASPPNYRAIVQQFGPAVVGVTVEGTRKVETGDWQGFDQDPFFQFFRGLPGFRMPGPRGEMPFHGQGSGFIIGADGLILTNAHVVRDAHEVTVKFWDRRELTAKVLGSDPATDVAVLRVDAKDLPTVKFGDPRKLQVGDYVLAIGAPFGFEESATAGIVSAKGRSLPGDAYVPFIQTDAAVNPGNSGGPLFNAEGGVVGINAQIYTQTGGYQGLAFAIPIDVALHAKDQIVATGHVRHARLGVMLQDLDQSLADSFGLSRPDGALVASVEADTPAQAAGLKPGDVITQFDGAPVQRAADVSTRVGLAAPGERVKLTVWRDRSPREVDVKLASAGKDPAGDETQASSSEPAHLGLALRPLTSEERRDSKVDHGLLVEESAGPAARAGILPGDVVLAINGRPAESVEQVRSALKLHPKTVALLIQRDRDRIFVPVKLG